MKLSSIAGLTIAGLLAAAIAAPAAAVMPVYMKYEGVDGSTAPGVKPDDVSAKRVKPQRSKPDPRTSRPNVAVGDLNGDGRADPRAAGRRDVKPPKPKPTGLLLPAIQKAR